MMRATADPVRTSRFRSRLLRSRLVTIVGTMASTGSDSAAVTSDADLIDRSGQVFQRYDLRPGTAYLIRPDQHVCARWRTPTEAAVRDALARATAAAV